MEIPKYLRTQQLSKMEEQLEQEHPVQASVQVQELGLLELKLLEWNYVVKYEFLAVVHEDRTKSQHLMKAEVDPKWQKFPWSLQVSIPHIVAAACAVCPCRTSQIDLLVQVFAPSDVTMNNLRRFSKGKNQVFAY